MRINPDLAKGILIGISIAYFMTWIDSLILKICLIFQK